jgi:precorrin-6B methylase 2
MSRFSIVAFGALAAWLVIPDAEVPGPFAHGTGRSAAAEQAAPAQQAAPARQTAPAQEKETRTDKKPDVIFVPTPQEVVDKMLELAAVKKGELVYDLGCGDGRIVVTAAKKFGAKGVGYDIDPERVKESMENVRKSDVGDLVSIKQKDIFTLDLSDANVVTLYLLPTLNVKLIPQLEKLKPGSRIVSHAFDMKGVKPRDVVQVKCSDGQTRTVYLWVTPLEKER